MTTVKDSILKYCLPALLVLWGGSPEMASGQTMFGIAGGRDARENAINCDWAYNWANRPRAETALVNYEYVPMIWSGGPNGVINQVNTIKNQEAAVGVPLDYVLGFNEPELSTQANMTVATAIATWEVIQEGFEGTGARLVSPAVSGQKRPRRLATSFHGYRRSSQFRLKRRQRHASRRHRLSLLHSGI